MKRFAWRQSLFAAMIVATAFFTWTYTSSSAPWESVAFVYEAMASTGKAVYADMAISPAPQTDGRRLSPATVTLTLNKSWNPLQNDSSMTYSITDLSNNAVIASGTTRSTAPIAIPLTVAAGGQSTFRVHRSAQRDYVEYPLYHSDAPADVDVVVYALPPEPAGPAVTTGYSVAPAADSSGRHASPAELTVTVTSNWDPAYEATMNYKVVDASNSSVVAQSSTTSQAKVTLAVPDGATRTFRLERSASVATPWGTKTESPGNVNIVVTSSEPAGPAVRADVAVNPASGSDGKYLSPAVATISATSLWGDSYATKFDYRVVDEADGSIVTEHLNASAEATVALTAPAGTQRTFRIEATAYASTPWGEKSAARDPMQVTVYAPREVTKLGKPSAPSKASTKKSAAISGTISPARTVGAKNVVKVAFYRWEIPKGKKKAAWVLKKTVSAKMTSATKYAASWKITKTGKWSVVASAAQTTAYTSAKSVRSRTITVR